MTDRSPVLRFEALLNELVSAGFDCGDWREGMTTVYAAKCAVLDAYTTLDAERQRVENELACGGVTCHANQYLKERDEALVRVEMLEAEMGYHDAQEVIRQLTSQRDEALAKLAQVEAQRQRQEETP